EQAGELHLLPFEGTASDEERRALGLPTRTEQLRAMEDENRGRAEARYRQPGLPEELNVARVWSPLGAADLAGMVARGEGVRRAGEDLTFAHRAEASDLHLMPALQLPL